MYILKDDYALDNLPNFGFRFDKPLNIWLIDFYVNYFNKGKLKSTIKIGRILISTDKKLCIKDFGLNSKKFNSMKDRLINQMLQNGALKEV